MRAALLTAQGPILASDYPVPQPAPGEALIRSRLVGICATDLELLRGYKGGYRGVLGHEFVGDVVAAPTAPEWSGRRVVGEINLGCGRCDLCRAGLGKHCRQRRVLGILNHDGAMAEFFTLPVANLHAVPAALADDEAVFVEPLAAALEIQEQVAIGPGTRVFVLGDGRLGLLCAMTLAATGCDLTLVGRHLEKMALLAGNYAARCVLDSPEGLDELAATPADVVVDAVGAPAGLLLALRLVRPLGTVVLKSTSAEHLADFDLSRLVVDEITVVGSRCGPFAKALHLLEHRQIDVRPLIHARYPLDEALAALCRASEKGVLKVLIDVWKPRISDV
jgi:threonine dehydrogenase-like Zn-dependent dehydrogenase